MSKEMQDLANRGEAAIAHFGVKGMRWGVRNATRVSSTKTLDDPQKPTVKRVNKKWVARGKNVAHEILDGAAIVMATLND